MSSPPIASILSSVKHSLSGAWQLDRDLVRAPDRFLALLLLTDAAFILLHLIHTFFPELLASSSFWLETDRGYAEVFQYVKEFWIVMLLGFLAIKRSRLLYVAWSILFFYFLLDDSLEIHERLGSIFVENFGFRRRYGLRAQDFGELSVSILFGMIFFTFILVTHYLSDMQTRKISRYLFVMIVLLAFFGVFIDMLHIIVLKYSRILDIMAGTIEDGGEMLIMSIITWFVFHLGPTNNEP